MALGNLDADPEWSKCVCDRAIYFTSLVDKPIDFSCSSIPVFLLTVKAPSGVVNGYGFR